MADTYKTFRMRKNGIVRCPITVAKAVICEDGNTVEARMPVANATVPSGTSVTALENLKIGDTYYSGGKTYTAGSGISISEDGVISVTFANGDDLEYGTGSSN